MGHVCNEVSHVAAEPERSLSPRVGTWSARGLHDEPPLSWPKHLRVLSNVVKKSARRLSLCFLRLCGSVILLGTPCAVAAQVGSLGSWNILNLQYKWNDRFSGMAEGQVRSLRLYNDFHYYEYKGAVTYKAMPGLRLTLGAGHYVTYASGGDFTLPKANDEFRLWPQVVLDGALGRVRLEQRYRWEMRYTSNGYRNRFRFRLGISYPFGRMKDGEHPYVLSGSNELFFTDNEPYFERNRAQVAINRRLTPKVALQLGYLHQFDYRINDEAGRDFLVIGVYLEFHRNQDQAPISPEILPMD